MVDGVAGGLINFRINQQLPDPASEVAFEAAQGFASGLALSLLAREELARRRIDPALADGDAVEGAVELAVAAAIEPVAGLLA
jgi:hypothetical protein